MKYRLTFEMVSLGALGKYSNADPLEYKNTTQIVPNSQIPDEDWHEVTRDADTYAELEDQFQTLKVWAAEDREFVRNPKIAEVAETVTVVTS